MNLQRLRSFGLITGFSCTIMKLLLQKAGFLCRPIERKEVFLIGHINSIHNPPADKRTYTVAEIMSILDISRKKAYELCHSGYFKIVHVGRSIRVSKSSFDAWLDSEAFDTEE